MEPKVSSSVSSPLERRPLVNTVASLRRIARHLEEILPGLEEGPLKDDLTQMRSQCYAAIPYYCSMETFSPKSKPSLIRQVADGALGMGVLGLSVPHARKSGHQ